MVKPSPRRGDYLTMQHVNSDDPWGFWNDAPTRPLTRVHAGTRSHGDTKMVPVVRAERTKRVPEPPRPRNPLMTRVCILVGSMLLLVPIALSLRADKQPVRAAEVKDGGTIFVGTMPPAPTDASVAADTAAPTTMVTTMATTTPAPTLPPPTEAAPTTAAPTAPPTTAAKVAKKAAPKPTTTPAPAPPAAATQAVAAPACNQTYTIAAGDAWSSIASRAKVSMNSLLAANGANTQTLLLPGKKVCLPDGAIAPGPPTTKPPATTQPPTTQPKATAPATTQPPPASTAPATTQPAPPANTYSKAQVTQIIRDVWPDSLEDEAIRIATRESGLVPTVKNYCCYGLFQIYYTAHKTWLASMGITSAAQLYDPRVNATAALALYNSNGWSPWGTPATTTTVSV